MKFYTLVFIALVASAISLHGQEYESPSGEYSGYTPGTFQVSDGGAATYGVDFVIPPGVNGMQPKLGISYSSQGGNGLLGIGWSLRGLSAITRSSKTLAQDGVANGVTFTSEDRFALDGERLVIANQAQVYGGDNTEYRTEQNAFSKITAHGQVTGNAPEYFVMKDKSGNTIEFGNSADSRVEVLAGTQQVPLFYLVSRVTDPSGNYMTFSYIENPITGEYYPDEINYSGNTNAGTVPFAKIKFIYSSRPDQIQKYMAGSIVTGLSQRMSAVQVFFGDEMVRSYNFAYQATAANLSELISMQECGRNGICHTPTTFQWSNSQLPQFVPFGFNTINIADNISVSGTDMNADGVQDFLSIPTNGNLALYMGNKDANNLNYTQATISPSITNDQKLVFGDFNGDGRTDIVKYATNGNHTLYLNDDFVGNTLLFLSFNNPFSTTLFSNNKQVNTGDYNNDGRTDFFSFDTVTGANYWSFSTSVGNTPSVYSSGTDLFTNLLPASVLVDYTPEMADFSGDGLIDFFFHRTDNGANVLYKSSVSVVLGAPPTFVSLGSNLITPSLIAGTTGVLFNPDFNADGLPDFMFYNKTGGVNRWWLNKGNNEYMQLSSLPSGLPSRISGGDYLLHSDFNADGYSDLIWIDKTTGNNRWFVGNGNLNFTELPNALLDASLIQGYTYNGIGNYTSKSMMDFCFTNTSGNPKLRVFRSITGYNNLISQIHQGSGQNIYVQYDYLTSDDTYIKFSDAIYPLMDYQATQFVVQQYQMDDGTGTLAGMKYKYCGAKAHMNGRGFRGYSEVYMTDLVTGVVQSKYFMSDENSWKYLNSPQIGSRTTLPNSNILSISDIENDAVTYFQGKCHYSFVRTNRSYTYEIDGTPVDTSETRYLYDDYGNAISIVTDYGQGWKDSLVNVFSNNPSTWVIGKLLHSKLYRSGPDGQSVVKSSDFEYDPTTGYLNREISEPDSSDLIRLEKSYTYDEFGNISTSVTRGWNGYAMEDRTVTTTYDSLGRFVVEQVNALGHSKSMAYDIVMATKISETDANGLTRTMEYDNFGRMTMLHHPDGNWQSMDYRICDVAFNCPSNTAHVIIEQSSYGQQERKYYDFNGREIRHEKKAFDGQWVLVDTEYNNKGLVARKSDPYFFGSTSVELTVLNYDLIGRNIEKISPGDRHDFTEYHGHTTVYTNPNGQDRTIVKNAKDKMVLSSDAEGNELHYFYDAAGRLVRTQDPMGNSIVTTYDVRGFETSMDDPDMGLYQYEFNSFGEIVKTIYPNGQQVANEYDLLGRIIRRTEPEGVTTWIYDTAPHGVGFLASIQGPSGYTANNTYDALSRVIAATQSIEGQNYSESYTYGSNGKIQNHTYPSGFVVRNNYNAFGYLSELRNADSQQVYWQATAVNARDQIEDQLYGNGLHVLKSYDAATGYMEGIMSRSATDTLQEMHFGYDPLGNVLSRSDDLIDRIEEFSYDNLNRLKKAHVLGMDSLIMQYDALSNILYKSDVGEYHYGSVNNGPHQLQSISLSNPRCAGRLEVETSYYSFNKVKQVTKDSLRLDVQYNASYQRIAQKLYSNNTLLRTKIYVSPHYEIITEGGLERRFNYVRTPDGVVATVVTTPDNQSQTSYMHRDHIGSLVMVTSETGDVVERFSYDAWGNRRNSDWSSALTDTTGLFADRGFTGHEHYALFDIVDMNGRIYDPVLARFMSPDMAIQELYNLANFNRYSYALNNPLTFTDPSGWFFKKLLGFLESAFKFAMTPLRILAKTITGVDIYDLAKHYLQVGAKWAKENWKTIVTAAVAIGVGVLTGGSGSFLIAMLSGAASGFAGGVTATLLNGGNIGDAIRSGLKGAAIGAISAGLTNGVGTAAQAAGTAGNTYTVAGVAIKIVGHGTVQGITSVLNGGKFEHGFLRGAVTAAASPVTSSFDSKAAQVVSSSLVAGTTSVLTGGDFANGAVSGAFVMMYNDWMHTMTVVGGGVGAILTLEVGGVGAIPGAMIGREIGQFMDSIENRAVWGPIQNNFIQPMEQINQDNDQGYRMP
jgi:RHS repeat-associated protein